jgi:tetratricopeptide (TPR) repeat protein
MRRTATVLSFAIVAVYAMAGVLLSSVTAQQRSSSVQEHFAAAQQDQQQGRLDAAVQEYQAALRLQPRLPEAYINLGLVYYAQARFQDSARALSTAGKLRPGMRGASLWLGIDEVRLHRPAQGAELLRQAIGQDPTDKLAQSWLATALWDAGKLDAALLELRRASILYPDDPDLLFARGEANGKAATQQTEKLLEDSAGTALSDLIYGAHYADEGDWVKSEGHLRRAIDREPRMLDAHLRLAETFLQQARLPDAQEQLNQASAFAPQSASVLARGGELSLLSRRPAEGLSLIEKAVAIDRSEALDALGLPVEDRVDGAIVDPKLSAMCRDALGSLNSEATVSPARDIAVAALYALAGDDRSAGEAYERVDPMRSSAIVPANLSAQAITALHEHRYDDAETALLRWIASNPSDHIARYDLILVWRRIAMTQVARLLAVAPDSYHVHQLLGQLYVSREEDDKALAEYLQVVAARPDLPDVHFWLGHLYWKHGDADHALTELARELQLSPGHPESEAELGTILVAEERAGEAIPHLESAIRSNPDLWPAYAQLGRAYAIEKSYPRAEEMLRRALAHDPDGNTHYQLALVLRADGLTSQAAQIFAQVRAIKAEKMSDSTTGDVANQGER